LRHKNLPGLVGCIISFLLSLPVLGFLFFTLPGLFIGLAVGIAGIIVLLLKIQ
jgi:hypothetical protein